MRTQERVKAKKKYEIYDKTTECKKTHNYIKFTQKLRNLQSTHRNSETAGHTMTNE